jgi:hypothetical protein
VRSIVFPVDPPVSLRQGDTVEVRFRSPGVTSVPLTAVSGIELIDIDPQCAFVTGDKLGLPPDALTDWDYHVRLYVH